MGCTSINQAEKGPGRAPHRCRGDPQSRVQGGNVRASPGLLSRARHQNSKRRPTDSQARVGAVETWGRTVFPPRPARLSSLRVLGGHGVLRICQTREERSEGFLICLTIKSGGIVDLQETRKGEVNGVPVLTCHLLILVFFDC